MRLFIILYLVFILCRPPYVRLPPFLLLLPSPLTNAGRVVVPGHVGIRNVKWLSKITLSNEEAHGVSDVINDQSNLTPLIQETNANTLTHYSLICWCAYSFLLT